jgi:hypothetical protein
MIRPLAATVALATLVLIPLASPGIASAQTWGQPVYLNAYGRPVGGSPLSEVETRSYVETGRRADGYSDRPRVYVPRPGYGRSYGAHEHGDRYLSRGYHSDGHDRRYASGHGYGTYGSDHDQYRDGSGRYDRLPAAGYRDVWGYNDDRAPTSARGRSDGSRHRGSRDCGCADVYFYDR